MGRRVNAIVTRLYNIQGFNLFGAWTPRYESRLLVNVVYFLNIRDSV